MKRHHITYLKNLAESITLNGEQTFQDKFYETRLPVMRLDRKVPICFVTYQPNTNKLLVNINSEPKSIKRLDSVEYEGKRYKRKLVQCSEQEFRYVLNFLVGDPSVDVLSEVANPGIIDQCVEYVAKNRKQKYEIPAKVGSVTEQLEGTIELYAVVDVGQSEVSFEYDEEGIFVVWIELIFRDGVYDVLELETLYGATLEIVPPVEVVED